VHATLHRSVLRAIEMITHENIARVIAATDRALKRMGTPAPKIAVGGLNPHIAAKLLAQNAVAALTIGSPFLFSSVAHGSAHDNRRQGRGRCQGHDRSGAAAVESEKVKERLGLQPATA